MATGSPDPDAPWPLALGHPPSYFDGLLEQAEKEARLTGFLIGIGGFVAGAAGYAIAKRRGVSFNARPLNIYHAGVITSRTFSSAAPGTNLFAFAVAGLVSSQLGTHYVYIIKQQEINEQRRREAFLRAEYRRKMNM
ncbi:hypothetical protein HDU96_006744 [Phlyctochytrium bullatum]|nr:hypothetical protein HDU96_006744 [Phlyctochytrium bullatum]